MRGPLGPRSFKASYGDGQFNPFTRAVSVAPSSSSVGFLPVFFLSFLPAFFFLSSSLSFLPSFLSLGFTAGVYRESLRVPHRAVTALPLPTPPTHARTHGTHARTHAGSHARSEPSSAPLSYQHPVSMQRVGRSPPMSIDTSHTITQRVQSLPLGSLSPLSTLWILTVHRHSTVQNTWFRRLKDIPCCGALFPTRTHTQTHTHTPAPSSPADLFAFSMVLSFPKCHTGRM